MKGFGPLNCPPKIFQEGDNLSYILETLWHETCGGATGMTVWDVNERKQFWKGTIVGKRLRNSAMDNQAENFSFFLQYLAMLKGYSQFYTQEFLDSAGVLEPNKMPGIKP